MVWVGWRAARGTARQAGRVAVWAWRGTRPAPRDISPLALSVLLVVLLAVGVHVLWSLVRGRKPALFTTFTRFRQASQHFSAGGWGRSGGFAGPRTEDVVDVQVHEVQDTVVALPRSATDKS